MTLKELCTQLGAPLMVRIRYPCNAFEGLGRTHTCYLDPERCSVVVYGKSTIPEPVGTGFNETEAITSLVRNLVELRKSNALLLGPDVVFIRCRSVYDHQIREVPIPADLTV